MKKIFFGVLMFFSSFVFLSLSTKSVLAVTFTRRPFLQNVTPTSIEFRWVTDTNEALIVKYGLSTSYGSQVTSNTVAGTGGNNNHAIITGLTVNTTYYYQITTTGGAALTPPGDTNYRFKTSPSVGSTTPFSFAIWGDSGNSTCPTIPCGSSTQQSVANQVNAKNPNLVFIAGDIAYPYSSDFNNNNSKYFNHYVDTMRFAPFYVTCGNHETSCPTVIADHSLPGGGNMGNGVQSTYSFDYGNVHFVALNSNASHGLTDPQMSWANNDIRAAKARSPKPWVVVYWHHNFWSKGSHSTLSSYEPMVRMSHDAGADLSIWGHSHTYERWPTNYSVYTGLQAYTVGNGGQSNTSGCKTITPSCITGSSYPGSTGITISNAGFLWFQVNGSTITANFVSSGGVTQDTISMTLGGGGATNTPGPSPTNIPTPTRTPTPIATNTPGVPSPTPTPGVKNGDACGNGGVTVADIRCVLNNWLAFLTNFVDQFTDGKVNAMDFAVVARLLPVASPTTGPSPTSGGPTPTPQTGELSYFENCDRTKGPFSLNINNPYYTLSPGQVHVIEGGGAKVQISVLNQTKTETFWNGVTARVIEEREWSGGTLIEVSYNWFTQAPNGTVCYYGEDVFDGHGNPIGGAWKAYDPNHPDFRPGIIMPATPAVGQTYFQEYAPGVATDRAEHIRFESSYVTPAGTFNNVLFVQETPPSDKRYAPGVGLIFDAGAKLTCYQNCPYVQ
ncbi:metallophosphoesterase [Candidatus Woesebacteria bacterium]|nr:metallophosphoesterase [Candidatus Woesebacteria bacterium]